MQRSLNSYVVGDNLYDEVHPPYCVKSIIWSMAEEIKQNPASKIECTLTIQRYKESTVEQVCTHPQPHLLKMWQASWGETFGPSKVFLFCWDWSRTRRKVQRFGTRGQKKVSRPADVVVVKLRLDPVVAAFKFCTKSPGREAKGMLKREVPQCSVVLTIFETLFTLKNIIKLLLFLYHASYWSGEMRCRYQSIFNLVGLCEINLGLGDHLFENMLVK